MNGITLGFVGFPIKLKGLKFYKQNRGEFEFIFLNPLQFGKGLDFIPQVLKID